jgi:hypothetical protein
VATLTVRDIYCWCLFDIGVRNLMNRRIIQVDFTSYFSLLKLTMMMRLRNPRQTLEKRFSASTLDIVRVGGRYRVRKLLGTGGSGELNYDSCLTFFSELVRECLSRKGHYDRG